MGALERLPGVLVVAALTSIGAGFIHAVAVGVHAEAREASLLFAGIAAFQIGWGVVVLVVAPAGTRRRILAVTGAAVNAGLVAGWYVATDRGISFVEGLEIAHGAGTSDVVAAALAAASAAAAVVAVVPASTGGIVRRPLGRLGLSVAIGALVASVTPGLVAASDHTTHDHVAADGDDHGDHDHGAAPVGEVEPIADDHHDDHDDHDHPDDPAAQDADADTERGVDTDTDDGGHDHDGHGDVTESTRMVEVCTTVEGEPDTHEHGDGSTHVHDDAAPVPTEVCELVESTAYHPDLPIDLSGMPGVSPEQQAAAENLVAVTLALLPRYASVDDAIADGFYSFGDGATGHEHYLNWDHVDDGRILDPLYPESLVYDTSERGEKRLVSAMFLLDSDDTLETVPDVGGDLMQWHVHGDLCMTDGEQPVLAGLRPLGGECSRGVEFPPIPMIHVWIEPNECGPFAALEGVGAGQVAAGEEKLCDHAHGSH